MIINKISSVSYAAPAANQQFASQNREQSVAFTSKPSKYVADVTTKVFDKLFSVRDNKLGTYLGTTSKGVNVTIRETSLGKSADLYISYPEKKGTDFRDFQVFHVNKSSTLPSAILNTDGEKVSSKQAQKLQRILDTLV